MRLLSILPLLALVPAPAAATSCGERAGDKAAIERTVHAFYDALGRDDRAAFKRQVTGDFVAFEYADRFSADELFALVAGAHREGVTITWGVGPMTIRVDCRTAYAHWDNRGSSGKAGKMASRRWRETAVFRRSATGWRIELFHSTAAEKP